MFSRLTPLLLAPALLLGACGSNYGGLESQYQPVVERNDYVFDVQTSGYGLAQGEPQRLAGWLASMRLRYGDKVSVDDGVGGATAREDIAALTNEYGLMLSDTAPVTVGQIAPGTVRVIVTRMTASVPGCPDFSRSQPGLSASTSSNFGCATNSNLAAMVADPSDLVRGVRGSPTTDPVTSSKAIGALRAAKSSGTGGTTVKADSATGGGN